MNEERKLFDAFCEENEEGNRKTLQLFNFDRIYDNDFCAVGTILFYVNNSTANKILRFILLIRKMI